MKRSFVALLFLFGCGDRPHQEAYSPKKIDFMVSNAAVVSTLLPAVKNSGMIEIDGDYCPVAEEICLRWVDSKGNTVKAEPGSDGRCGEFKKPTRCLSSKKTKKHFFIDKYEYPNVEGQVPQDWMTWYNVKDACESQGKRLCTQSEWAFACEGPEMQPYPYGDGYHRDKTSCNFDNAVPENLFEPINPKTHRHPEVDVFKATSPKTQAAFVLNSLLVASGAKKACVSPFGVHDQVGNVDEFVVNESGKPYASGLMGGHVFGVRSRCRPMTDAHYEGFTWYETSGRCCKSGE